MGRIICLKGVRKLSLNYPFTPSYVEHCIIDLAFEFQIGQIRFELLFLLFHKTVCLCGLVCFCRKIKQLGCSYHQLMHVQL